MSHRFVDIEQRRIDSRDRHEKYYYGICILTLYVKREGSMKIVKSAVNVALPRRLGLFARIDNQTLR